MPTALLNTLFRHAGRSGSLAQTPANTPVPNSQETLGEPTAKPLTHLKPVDTEVNFLSMQESPESH